MDDKIVDDIKDTVEEVSKPEMGPNIKRIPEIDFFKGIAVLSMVIFHIFYMANMMNIANFPIHNGILQGLARTAQLIFISCIGINLVLSSQKHKYDRKTYHERKIKRVIYMVGVALIITYLTRLAFPDKYVKFGIVHFAAASIFLLQWIAGSEIAIFTVLVSVLFIEGIKKSLIPFFAQNIHPMLSFIIGIYNPKYSSMDHFSLIPNIAIVCIGMLIGYALYKDTRRKYREMDNILDPFFALENRLVNSFKWIGKRSFLIYMIHFPVIYFIYRYIQKLY